MKYYDVFVPAEGRLDSIAPGSAIVGELTNAELHDGRRLVQVYYEGNLYGAMNMDTYEGRMVIAADRLSVHYPTIAQRLVPVDDLICIGTWCHETQTLDVEEPELLEAWKAQHWQASGGSMAEAWQKYRMGVRH
jgi:hypothetical protein